MYTISFYFYNERITGLYISSGVQLTVSKRELQVILSDESTKIYIF